MMPGWQQAQPRLILASASTARRQLLESVGLSFVVIPADVDEAAVKRQARRDGVGASALALLLAETKAHVVADRRQDAMVIGADQVLESGSAWFDKPATLAEARHQLQRLRGTRQVLHTAIVLMRDGHVVWRHVATPTLTMRPFSDAVLDMVLEREGEALLACVGACRVEGFGQLLFETIDGEHSAILGLPLLPMLAALRGIGLVLA